MNDADTVEAMIFSVATFERITVNPAVCTGKPCIRNLRFPVSRLLGLLAAGQTREEILQAYPYLESADIDQALGYAASLAEDETVPVTDDQKQELDRRLDDLDRNPEAGRTWEEFRSELERKG